jgi:4,5-dihydroxyphthalate decarboxylase
MDLRYLPIVSSPEIFARMVKNRAFDASEMSLAHYLIERIRGEFPFIAIPVFPSRVFRHGYIFINRNSGIKQPKDLEGKRVGVQEFRQTAGVWIRGILQHEYGVDLDTIRWFEGGVNTPRKADDVMDLRPIPEIPLELIAPDATLNDMLEAGEIDAYFGARRPTAMDTGENVARLFPDYREHERAYFLKTGIHPVMHTVVIREELYRERPWVAESLYKACEQSKAWVLAQMRHTGAQRYMFPWMFDEIAEMDELFDGNPFPYGLEPNRHLLETFMRYLVDQYFLSEPAAIDDLFAPMVSWRE